MKSTLWAILCFMLIMPGCGGGGTTSQAPAVSNLVLLSGGVGTFNISFNYSDPGGDVATVTVVLYNAAGTKLDSSTGQIANITGHTSGTIRGTLDFSSLSAGDYSVQIYITNSGGFQSNTLSNKFSATGGFRAAANIPNPSNYLHLGDTAIGDLNGDGRNDVVAIQGSRGVPGTVYLIDN